MTLLSWKKAKRLAKKDLIKLLGTDAGEGLGR